MGNLLRVKRVRITAIDQHGVDIDSSYGLVAVDANATILDANFKSFEELNMAIDEAGSILAVVDPDGQYFPNADHKKIGKDNYEGEDWELSDPPPRLFGRLRMTYDAGGVPSLAVIDIRVDVTRQFLTLGAEHIRNYQEVGPWAEYLVEDLPRRQEHNGPVRVTLEGLDHWLQHHDIEATQASEVTADDLAKLRKRYGISAVAEITVPGWKVVEAESGRQLGHYHVKAYASAGRIRKWYKDNGWGNRVRIWYRDSQGWLHECRQNESPTLFEV